MDERVSVDALDGASGWKRILWFTAACLGACECEHGADALATSEEAVAHGLVDGWRLGGDSREEAVEGAVDQFQALAEILLKKHARGLCREGFCAGNRKPYSTKR